MFEYERQTTSRGGDETTAKLIVRLFFFLVKIYWKCEKSAKNTKYAIRIKKVKKKKKNQNNLLLFL